LQAVLIVAMSGVFALLSTGCLSINEKRMDNGFLEVIF